MCPHTAIYVSLYSYMCVLILLYMCPHPAKYVGIAYTADESRHLGLDVCASNALKKRGVASALALLMYEMSGRGLGLRQVLRLLALLVQKDTY